MKENKFFIIFNLLIVLFLMVSFGCNTSQEAVDASSAESKTETIFDTHSSLREYEGLHITGSVIEVDIINYRLRITGSVQNLSELTFDEVKELPSVREYVELDCPGYFVDNGYWTGVRVLDLLKIAGLKDNAKRVKFISIDKSYSQILSLEEIKPEGFLIAYHFNDKEFSKYHGFPLRLVAKDLPGNIWVKWLGEIEVLD